ncbi:MAG: phage holin family protein [Dehalococcoidia bacterium]|nr:phage holin family protein [Dehalococcoidia bacterium]
MPAVPAFFIEVRRSRDQQTDGVLGFLLRWAVTAAAVWAADSFVGGFSLGGWGSTLAVALILGLLNAFVRPVLVLLTLPVTVMTLGLFLLVLNAGLLAAAVAIANQLEGVHAELHGIWPAIAAALIISAVSWVLTAFVKER